MTDEDAGNEARELEMGIAQMEQIKAQVESLRGQTNSLQSILMDYSNSLEVIGDLMDNKEDDALMPVGGSAFVKVRITDTETCLMDRGAGIFVDTPMEQAKDLVQERMKSIRDGISRMERTIQELMQRYEEISRNAQELYNKQMSSGQGPEKTF
jgi:prefoldin alpha subunit